MPLFRETAALWADEFAMTERTRFRGSSDYEVQPLFLYTHYVIERHREMLLLSFFVARSDTDLDGVLSWREREQMLRGLGMTPHGEPPALVRGFSRRLPVRQTLSKVMETELARAGLNRPSLTEIEFTSLDGYGSYGFHNAPFRETAEQPAGPACNFRVWYCLGSHFARPNASVSTNDLFRRIAFEKRDCGDCALLHLVGLSGPTGLSALLPSSMAPERLSPIEDVAGEDMMKAKSWREADFTAYARRLAKSDDGLRTSIERLLLKYAYTLGNTPYALVSLKRADDIPDQLADLGPRIAELFDEPDDQAAAARRRTQVTVSTFVLNDDLAADEVVEADEILADFFETMWPEPAPWEQVRP